nr:unnamed protein product [Digitaria exilis]
MASLFAGRSLPARRHRHRHLPLFTASSSHPIGSHRYLVFPSSCSAREVLDVTPQRDDGRRPRTEEDRAGSTGVRYGTNGGTVRRDTTTREAGTPVQREGSRGVPRPWKKGDRVVVKEREDWESQEKNRRRGPIQTGEQEWRRDANSWTRGGKGMFAKESGNAGNSRDVGRETRNETKKNKRVKVGEQGGKLRVLLDMCSKRGDVMGAISLYDSAVEDGIRLGQHHYNVLLYLCSSAALGFVQPAKSGNTGSGITSIDPAQKLDLSPEGSLGCSDEGDTSQGHVREEKEKPELPSGDLNVQTVTIPIGDELREYARARGFEIFEKMCAEKERVQMSEAALTAKARMALSMGDGDMAFEIVKQMKDLGITPKLRSYGPALTAFCNSGNVDKAFEVEAHMLKSGITPEEAELEMLLRVHFTYDESSVALQMPPPYSVVIQVMSRYMN